jgi:branched-chain amino acid transport system permease protein
MEFFIISTLNGLSYGLLLFMLSAGLTLIFSMMGVLNFAHASFYMVGAYVGYTLSGVLGFWPALVLAPVIVGALGALFERLALRRVHKYGHVAELLITFGLSYIIYELVQLIWGRTALEFNPPGSLQGPAFTLINHAVNGMSLVWGAAPTELCSAADATVRVVCSPFPLTRAFMMFVALLMLVSLWLLLTHTRVGLVIQSALTHPHMAESLGHNVPLVFMLVFGAGTVGSIIFVVVVVGGLGSLSGAFLASLLIGVIQTFAIAFDYSVLSVMEQAGLKLGDALRSSSVAQLTLSQVAPILPYLFLVLILIFRPRGLLGKREG